MTGKIVYGLWWLQPSLLRWTKKPYEKHTHTHILHSQLRATEGNLMLHPSPSDDFLFEKSQSSDTSTTYQKTRHHVLFSLIFFAGFLFEETKSWAQPSSVNFFFFIPQVYEILWVVSTLAQERDMLQGLEMQKKQKEKAVARTAMTWDIVRPKKEALFS